MRNIKGPSLYKTLGEDETLNKKAPVARLQDVMPDVTYHTRVIASFDRTEL
jgi:hypothetical protein